MSHLKYLFLGIISGILALFTTLIAESFLLKESLLTLTPSETFKNLPFQLLLPATIEELSKIIVLFIIFYKWIFSFTSKILSQASSKVLWLTIVGVCLSFGLGETLISAEFTQTLALKAPINNERSASLSLFTFFGYPSFWQKPFLHLFFTGLGYQLSLWLTNLSSSRKVSYKKIQENSPKEKTKSDKRFSIASPIKYSFYRFFFFWLFSSTFLHWIYNSVIFSLG